jgi:hypothetical protein
LVHDVNAQARGRLAFAALRWVLLASAVGSVGVLLAWLVAGTDEALRCLFALLACLPGGAFAHAVTRGSLASEGGWRNDVLIAGFFARMALGLALGALAYRWAPACGNVWFWLWLVAVYLALLLVESIVMVRDIPGFRVAFDWSVSPPPSSGLNQRSRNNDGGEGLPPV